MNTIEHALHAAKAALQSDDVPPLDTKDRAIWRIRFVLAAMYDGQHNDVETAVKDLLTDLVHLGEVEDIDPHDLLEGAEWMAEQERQDWAHV